MNRQEMRKRLLNDEFGKHQRAYSKLIDAWCDCAKEFFQHFNDLEYMRDVWDIDYRKIVGDKVCDDVLGVIDEEIERIKKFCDFFGTEDYVKWDEMVTLADIVNRPEVRFDDDYYEF